MIDGILHEAAARLAGRVVLDDGKLPVTYYQRLEVRQHDLPDWWAERGNVMLCPPDMAPPRITLASFTDAPSHARVVLGCAAPPDELLLWGEAPIVLMGEATRFPGGRICCGGGSTIIIGDRTSTTWNARIDCRNGGIVRVGADGLWAAGVQINSDDMHAIRDFAGKRLNAFGGVVAIDRAVWLAYEVLVLNGARIGAETVVGARGVVTGALPGNSVCVGMPARAIRHGTRWAFDDLP